MAVKINTEGVSKAWIVVTEVLSPSIGNKRPNETEFHNAVDVMSQNGLAYIIEEWFVECLQQHLRRNVAPKFWNFFDLEQSEILPEQLGKAVNYLHEITMGYLPCIDRLNSMSVIVENRKPSTVFNTNNLSEAYILLIKSIIFFVLPAKFCTAVEMFYSQAFKVFHHSTSEDEEEQDVIDEEEEECKGCDKEQEDCVCKDILDNFHTINRQLDDIGILERVSGMAVTSIVHERIKNHIENTCKGNFETSYLKNLEEWLDSKVLGWLTLVYSGNCRNTYSDCIEGFKGRLLHFLYETFARTHIDQLFNIIIEFPESEPAILDLKVCLEKTDLRGTLVSSLKTALETRLLHPGVNTSDILTAYIAAIRALRILDPVGVILELVCDPVRKYLRSRDDTVRQIVSNLTDDGSNELLEELQKGQPLLDDGCSSDDELEDWENWMPDPVDADPRSTSKSRRASDIISMLVNIYGSKELFVQEYRTLLADRILTQFNYEIVKEIRYLELLKLRFGESQLHYCEVMLKDVADSKRLNSRIMDERRKSAEREEIEVNSMVLSAQFWPAFREEKIKLPEVMQKSLEEYTKKFEALKGNRTLNWKPHLGLVNIDVELKDRTLNFNVSPVHAAIIIQFQSQETWTVEELSNVLQMPATALRRKIAYWQTQGLLREEVTDKFVLVEEHKGRAHDVIVTDDDEAESAMASAQTQREEELQVFWSYIVGMLTNLESLTIDRIHSILRMFAMQGPSVVECSIPELKHFLDSKVRDQKLLFSGGVYRLPKPDML
ncbi:anaphase-promoting complex subunit 2-like [Saccostrea echinata]|uniref:anaphase-promoting complex subunit 2-like n=1 Tax=Saccostrea echinata TaxID=191078 RepID=UPI002A7ECDEA|nr:anaphase-promoting complex subunit 2-like [Saccostrea echinata]